MPTCQTNDRNPTKFSLSLTVSQVFLLWAAASSKLTGKLAPSAKRTVTMEEFYQRPYCNTSTMEA